MSEKCNGGVQDDCRKQHDDMLSWFHKVYISISVSFINLLIVFKTPNACTLEWSSKVTNSVNTLGIQSFPVNDQ